MSFREGVLVVSFSALALVMLVKSYYPIIRALYYKIKKSNRVYADEGESIDGKLAILSSSGNAAEKANAFVCLMNLSYILVHTMINQGNNYSDELQQKKFKQSLTPQTMDRLKALEGRYE